MEDSPWNLPEPEAETAAEPGEPRPPDAYELAMQAARSGRPQDGIEILMRELGQERSGRGRFNRKVQLSQLCVSAGHDMIALPMLQELAAEIERRKLEDWETPDLVARPLALLYQCLGKQGDSEQRSKLYAWICRLDPLMAHQLFRGKTFRGIVSRENMARWEPEQTVTQSVLERLIDRDPQGLAEPPPTRNHSVRLLRASVRRDLEWLLNTRRIPEPAGEEFPKSARSLYNFGLPDLNALNWESSRDRHAPGARGAGGAAVFEPRLRGMQVVPLEPVPGSPHVMRFQIEGLLDMDPTPEHISFDTTLQLSSGEYQVKGDSSAG